MMRSARLLASACAAALLFTVELLEVKPAG